MKFLLILLFSIYSFGCEIQNSPQWICYPPDNGAVGFDSSSEKLAIAKAKVELAEIQQTNVITESYREVTSDGGSIHRKQNLLTTKLTAEYKLVDKWIDDSGGVYVLVTKQN